MEPTNAIGERLRWDRSKEDKLFLQLQRYEKTQRDIKIINESNCSQKYLINESVDSKEKE